MSNEHNLIDMSDYKYKKIENVRIQIEEIITDQPWVHRQFDKISQEVADKLNTMSIQEKYDSLPKESQAAINYILNKALVSEDKVVAVRNYMANRLSNDFPEEVLYYERDVMFNDLNLLQYKFPYIEHSSRDREKLK